MAKWRAIKNSFIAGEVSPQVLGRTDLPQYPHACETLKNMIPFLSGGAYRRPGTFFETSFAAATDRPPRIIPFVVSKTEAYALLFGKVIAGSATVYPLRPTSNIIASQAGTCSGTHPYLVGTVSNGYYDEVHDVQFVQSADVMHLVHPTYKPRKLSRSAIDTFAIDVFDSALATTGYRDGRPYRAQNSTAITLTINTATIGTVRTLTASAAFFASTHVGAVFKVDDGAGTYGCALVTGFTSSTQVTVTVIVAFGDTAAHLTWWESSWSDYRGWPRAVGYYQGRRIFAGNASEPDSLWFSQSSNYDVMSVSSITAPTSSPTGAQPFQITLSSQQLNQIQWISADKTLTVGTLGDEFIIEPEQAGGFGCDNVKATPQSHYGSSYHQPARFNDELVFALPSDKEIKSIIFSEFENTYKGEPIQLLYGDFPRPEVRSIKPGARKYRAFAWDQSRDTLWCLDTSGQLVGMTRERALGVTMWHSHQFGGYDATLTDSAGGVSLSDPAYFNCAGSVISMAVIPNPLIGTNDVWLVVKRKINSLFVYHVERMIGEHFPYETVYNTYFQHLEGVYHVDAAVYSAGDYPLAEDGVYSGLNHLTGETPYGTASNSRGLQTIYGNAVVGGLTTLQGSDPPHYGHEVTTVELGLPFTSIIKPVRPEAGSVIGTSQGTVKIINELTIRFYKTLAAKFGRDTTHLETITFRDGDTAMGYTAEIFTGDKHLLFDGSYDRDGYVVIIQDKPLPFAVMAIIAEGQTWD